MAAEIKKNWLTTRMTVTLGLLIALEIVLSRFLSFAAWNMKIGFAFVPVALAAMLYGPVAAAIVGGLGDIIGALMFPIGPYAPGFTVTAVLMGLVLGFLLQKRRELWRVLTAVCVNQLVLSLFLNTLWISMLYSSASPRRWARERSRV